MDIPQFVIDVKIRHVTTCMFDILSPKLIVDIYQFNSIMISFLPDYYTIVEFNDIDLIFENEDSCNVSFQIKVKKDCLSSSHYSVFRKYFRMGFVGNTWICTVHVC